VIVNDANQRPRVIEAACYALALAALLSSLFVIIWAQVGVTPESNINRIDACVSFERLGESWASIGEGLPQFFARTNTWLALGLWGLWLLSILGWGGIGQRFLFSGFTFLETGLFRFGAGVIWSGLLIATLGVCGMFSYMSLGGILSVGVALLLIEVARLKHHRPQIQLKFSLRSVTAFIVALSCLLLFFSSLLYAMTPPMQSDGMRYHLGAIQEYLARGRIAYLPRNAFSNFPFLAEMHFAFGVVAGVPEVSQLIHFSFYLATGLMVAAVSRWLLKSCCFGSEVAGRASTLMWIPAFLYWACPANAIVAAWPFIDQAVNFYWLAAVLAWLATRQARNRAPFVLMGTMLGGALGTKYTSLAFATILIFLAAYDIITTPVAVDEKSSFERLKRLCLAAGVAGITGCFWFVKNIVFTGNPFYPLAGRLFGYGEFGPENAALYAAKMAEKGVPKTFAHLFLSPLSATFQWTLFEHHFLGSIVLICALSAVVMLMASAYLQKEAAKMVRLLFILIVAVWALWFFTYQSNRMLGSFIALAAPFAALSLCCPFTHGGTKTVFAAACLAAGVHGAIYVVHYEGGVHRPPLPAYVSGTLTRDSYLAESLNYYRAFAELSGVVQTGEKVLLIGEHRIFYARFRGEWSDWFDTPAILDYIRRFSVTTAPQLLDVLRNDNVRWVLVNDAELAPQFERYWRPRFRDAEWQIYERFMEKLGAPWKRVKPGVSLYKLSEKPT